jgi:hypothetical protein
MENRDKERKKGERNKIVWAKDLGRTKRVSDMGWPKRISNLTFTPSEFL